MCFGGVDRMPSLQRSKRRVLEPAEARRQAGSDRRPSAMSVDSGGASARGRRGVAGALGLDRDIRHLAAHGLCDRPMRVRSRHLRSPVPRPWWKVRRGCDVHHRFPTDPTRSVIPSLGHHRRCDDHRRLRRNDADHPTTGILAPRAHRRGAATIGSADDPFGRHLEPSGSRDAERGGGDRDGRSPTPAPAHLRHRRR